MRSRYVVRDIILTIHEKKECVNVELSFKNKIVQGGGGACF